MSDEWTRLWEILRDGHEKWVAEGCPPFDLDKVAYHNPRTDWRDRYMRSTRFNG